MTSRSSSPTSETTSGTTKVKLLVVRGLQRQNDGLHAANPTSDGFEDFHLWDEIWLRRMGFPECEVCQFEELSSDGSFSDPEYLSPVWFDEIAAELLDYISKHADPTGQTKIIFFAENLGGLILKRALASANTKDISDALSRSTCACVFIGVPHWVGPPQQWSQILISIVLPLWDSLPNNFWASTSILPSYFNGVSADFMEIASRISIISIYQRQIRFNISPDPHTMENSWYTIGVSHENRVARNGVFASWNIGKFGLRLDDNVKRVFDILRNVITVPTQARDYLKVLSRLGPNPQPLGEDTDEPIIDVSNSISATRDASTIFLHGNHGSGKGLLLRKLYRRLLHSSERDTQVAYFAFDARDNRRSSASSMLAKIILQLLINSPSIMKDSRDLISDGVASLTEGRLWMQLRQIVHLTTQSSVHLLIDSIADYDSDIFRMLMGGLSDLQVIAPGRFKTWITTTTCREVELPGPGSIACLRLSDMPELKTSRSKFQQHLVSALTRESSELVEVEVQLEDCLKASECFRHSELIAHRVRSIDLFEQPRHIKAELNHFATSWKETMIGTVQRSPAWILSAIGWILFSRRPFNSTELAIAVALSEYKPVSGTMTDLDPDCIRRDIDRNLKRYLGPIVDIALGEIRISHPFVREVLQDWATSRTESSAKMKVLMTEQALSYLNFCLKNLRMPKEESDKSSIIFSLSGYFIENWHVHYRDVVADARVGRVDVEDMANLEQHAKKLLEQPDVITLLWPRNRLTFASKLRDAADSGASQGDLGPEMLAARLGLSDLFNQLSNSSAGEHHTYALRLACESGHVEIANHMLKSINTETAIEPLLRIACDQGDQAMIKILLERVLHISPLWKAPPKLLFDACRTGQTLVVEKIIQGGADLDSTENRELSPLHEAVQQGHLSVVDLLLRKGAKVNFLDERRWTPLQKSIHLRYLLISHRILEEDGLIDGLNGDNLDSMHLAAQSGDVDLLEKVIHLPKSDPDPEHGETYSSPLHEAALRGHLDAVRLLLNHRIPVDTLNSHGETALYLALSSNHQDVADLLFENHASIGSIENYAKSALKQAVIHGNMAACVNILQIGGYPENVDREASPLTDAAQQGHVGIIENLFKFAKSDVNVKVDHMDAEDILGESVNSGWSAMHFAAYYGHLDVARLLSQRNPNSVTCTTQSRHTILHLAVFKGHVNIVNFLLSKPTVRFLQEDTKLQTINDGSETGTAEYLNDSRYATELGLCTTMSDEAENSSLCGSAEESYVPATSAVPPKQITNSAKVDVNATSEFGRTSLHIAAANSQIALTRLLIRSGASARITDKTGRTSLHFAASSSSLDDLEATIDALLSQGVDINARDFRDETPLHYAADMGSTIATHILIQRGANVNAVSIRGRTALHNAALRGNLEAMNVILKNESSPNTADKRGDTPLHDAARRGHIEAVKLLVQHGAAVNATGSLMMTPLQRAVMRHNAKVVRFLLDSGADPNLHDEDGDTAITVAVLAEAYDVLDVLLDRDSHQRLKYAVDVNVKNNEGKTPIMLAVHAPDMIKVLYAAGADMSDRTDDGLTILHEWASGKWVSRGDSEKLASLLSNGTVRGVVNDRSNEGLTPLHLSARHGQVAFMRVLRNSGADLTIKDYQGRTPMHFAVRSMSLKDFREVFKDFLQPSSSNRVNIADEDGWTPFHWACKGSHDGVLELLLSQYDNPMLQLQLPCKHNWSAMDIFMFHRKSNILAAIDIWKSSLGSHHSTDESLSPKGATRNDDFPLSNSNSKADEEVILSNISKIGRKLIQGSTHHDIVCDDCEYGPIRGFRYKCRVHDDFDLCFKCYWHHSKTHPDHEFDGRGEGPTEGPYLDNESGSPLPSRRGSADVESSINLARDVLRNPATSGSSDMNATLMKNMSRRRRGLVRSHSGKGE